jgi:DNA polymerase elongation subunit (family B)
VTATEPALPGTCLDPEALVFGADPTPGIVSVDVRADGSVTVWRRVDGQVLRETDSHEPWFLARSLDVLAPLGDRLVPLQRGQPIPADALAGYEMLEGDNHYRLLVRVRRLADVDEALMRGYRDRHAGLRVEALREMRGEIYIRSQVEQYLIMRGRTYFKGFSYDDVRRMQIDLETTDLSPERGTIFMIALRDNHGFKQILDGAPERELIAELVRLVVERDPDIVENHNIMGFDLPFLITRARKHGVRLALGRDGGEFEEYTDSLKLGPESQRFRRYALVGREIIDTLHAVQRYDAVVRHMRHHTLKNAARYFGVAREDREYVEGAQIYAEYQRNPERVRRYALHDVEEVDGLSRALMGATFMLASMVPRPYEKVATSGTGQGLVEPLLLRAYVAARHTVPSGRGGREYEGGATALFRSGVLSHVVKADVASLYPSIMLTFGVAPRSDARLNAMLTVLEHLMRRRLRHKAEARRLPPLDARRAYHDALQGAVKILINSFYGSLGNAVNLFADADAAAEVTRRGRDILLQMLSALEERGMELIEADTDGVIFATPEHWTEEDERGLVAEVSALLPEGINIEHDGRWARMYSYMEKNYALLGYDGTLTIKGSSFRSSRNEFYGEHFFRAVLPLVMSGDMAAARALYLETVRRIRRREMPVRDLCISTRLTKSPEEYRAAGRKEEPYEVMRAAKRRWAVGDRIVYYQASRGRRKLLEQFADDYDVEYYVRKLTNTYCARLSKAIPREHFAELFGEQLTLFATPPEQIAPLVTVETTLEDVKRRML